MNNRLYFFKDLFILEKESAWVGGEAEGENLQVDSPLSTEPVSGLDLTT